MFWLNATNKAQAQTVPVTFPQPQDTIRPQVDTLPELPLPQELPSADELLGPSQGPSDQPSAPTDSATFLISRFNFINNTAFDDETLQAVTDKFLGQSQTF
ncbi:MAG: ShlB/FhaC/HecB family hemolysin secretion/activation protein, partial [Cyanobacteria bacterium P01_H01_bin.105]